MRAILIAAILAALSVPVPAHSECLRSADAVWNAHPGSHATWRLRLPGHEGTKCWFARGSTGLPAPRVRMVADSSRGAVYGEADRRTARETILASSQVTESAFDAVAERTARSGS